MTLLLFIISLLSIYNAETLPNPSFGLTNFKNAIMTWCNTRADANSSPNRAPGICNLRWSNDNYGHNSISEDGFVFKYSVGSDKYEATNNLLFDGKNTISWPGVYSHLITKYNSKDISSYITLEREMLFPPEKNFLIINYRVKNTAKQPAYFNLFDYLKTDSYSKVKTGYSASTKTLYADLSADTSMFVGLGLIDDNTFTYQVGGVDSDKPIDTFNSNDVLSGKNDYTASKVTLSLQSGILIDVNEELSLTVYRVLGKDLSELEQNAKEARSKTYNQWLEYTEGYMTTKTKNYQKPTFTRLQEEKFYNSSILTMLHAQNPTLGTIVASFHQYYYYKVWSRDAAFAAYIMDNFGEHEGAEKFLIWLSNCDLRETGAFSTNYDWWTGNMISFVEPQYDGVGASLAAYYNHYILTKDMNFLNRDDVKNRIRQLEDFLLKEDYAGFIPADYSIWEESSDGRTGQGLPVQYYAFTQAMGYAGIQAAIKIEELYGDNDRKTKMSNRAVSLKQNIDQYYWHNDNQMYVQSIWSDTKSQKVVVDATTAAMFYTGLVDNEERIKIQMNNIRNKLTQLEYGIGRYENDPYFYDSIYSPGGKESSEAMPAWGVTTCFVAWAEVFLENIDGHRGNVQKRIDWMVDHTGDDFMPCGEAVNPGTGNPIMSSMPDIYEHAGVFINTLLLERGLIKNFNPQSW